jgi:hypothetical protein
LITANGVALSQAEYLRHALGIDEVIRVNLRRIHGNTLQVLAIKRSSM